MRNLKQRARSWGQHWRPRWQRAQTVLLRILLRLVPNERQRVFGLTLVLGVVCGLAAVAFHLAITAAEGALIDRALAAPGRTWIGWTLITPTVGGLLGGVLLAYVVPDARGSGIPQVKVAYAIKGGRMPFRVAIGKFLLSTLQIGSGASLGREGPTVQICAGITSLFGRITALSREQQRRLLPIGAAAGIAAAFNAPIAAVTFTIEEVVGDLDQTVLSGVVVAAALAAAVERSVLGAHPVLTIPAGYGLDHPESLLLYAVLGVVAALVAIAFTEGLLLLRRAMQQLTVVPVWARPGLGGLATGVLIVVALVVFRTGGINGGGYDTLGAALAGNLPVTVLLGLCVLKLLATVCSYSSGGAGGIFAPALFIGGMLGGAVGYADVALFHHAHNEIGAFALVGMGAVFAGIIRAPITSVLIIFEMTGGYDLILPLMLANMTAYGLARRLRPVPIYEALLAQDGVELPHRQGPLTHALERLTVRDAMTRTPSTLSAQLTVRAALARTADDNRAAYPVLTADNQFVGLISTARLQRAAAEGQRDEPIGPLADRRLALTPEQPLTRAVALMDRAATRQLAVVTEDQSPRLAGVLTLSDIVRAQAQMVQAHGDLPAEESFSEVAQTLTRGQD